ncbi:AraC family transcriptional regulator [Longispora fulva]|uniref:AraC-like DNA-binding protein n=1 Tax=Longispora fulva TaxID=619741 RepID=A0A8J7GQC7_9ACTN|nr:helix-turn-helix transcriptional regulator [Longispora fulva]MBG6134986.1 AraC-like DNA-binding protein [Longispora fulva]GIG56782.1 AraC family transcriptional regulator [Longispora fulva]
MQKAVERAISIMWDRYHEPLSLDAMAGSAFLSRFYFSRLFRSSTGTSPGRYLTAIRLYKAKNLLLETDMTVTDIAYGVGYNSLGTFISRFTRSVGISPARYRWLSQHGIPQLSRTTEAGPPRRATLGGHLLLPHIDVPVKVYVGVFDSPIVQGLPAACDILETSGAFVLRDIPEGEWHLRAAAIALDDIASGPSLRRPLAVGAHDPIFVVAGADLEVDLELHPIGSFDMPILFALPELDKLAATGNGRPVRRDRRAATARMLHGAKV